MSKYYEILNDLGGGLLIVSGPISKLSEQTVNAHVMEAGKFNRLTENIRKTGRMESLAYCAQPDPSKPPEIVSGHHRMRAAKAAGLETVPYLLDTNLLTRSQIIAKQLAHNALVGTDDTDLLKRLAKMMTDVDDMLESGLAAEYLPSAGDHAVQLYTPHADFQFKTVTLSFLEHQLDNLKELIGAVHGSQDLVLVAMSEQFEAFVKATAAYARIKDVRAAGTIVALLTDIALREVKIVEDAEREKAASQEEPKSAQQAIPGQANKRTRTSAKAR